MMASCADMTVLGTACPIFLLKSVTKSYVFTLVVLNKYIFYINIAIFRVIFPLI